MADPANSAATGDDVLTAYLDNELPAEERRMLDATLAADPALKARLDALATSNAPYKQAFALVLDAAPQERLMAMIAEIVPSAQPRAPRGFWRSAAAVGLLFIGVGIGVSVRGPLSEQAIVTTAAVPAPVVATQVASLPAAAAPSAQKPAVTAPLAGIVADQSAPVASASGRLADAATNRAASETAPAGGGAAARSLNAPVAAAPAAPKAVAPPTATFGAPPSGVLGPQASLTAPPVPAPAPPATLAAPPPAAAAAPAAAPSWRQVVAEYLVLTTPDTLALLPQNPRLGEAVAAYGGKLQLAVSTDTLMLPMATLKDVRLFDYRGRSLIQAAYLSDDAMAVAFCIIVSMQPDAPIAFEEREGQNIVFWTKNGHAFMVAGTVSRERLEALARDLSVRFAS